MFIIDLLARMQICDKHRFVEIENIEYLENIDDERKLLKRKLTEIQRRRLVESMMKASKTDSMLLNFSYDGGMKGYLLQLPFNEARIIFMLRSRMFPTKSNFPNRWSSSILCTFCCNIDTDEHLFQWCGYMDTHKHEISYRMFMMRVRH